MRTSGNTVVITGGTSGIGWALAERFANGGNKVIVCGRREDRLRGLAAKHAQIAARACDVADGQQRAAFASWVLREHPEANILVNNAGIQLAVNLRAADMDKVLLEIETNFVAPLHLASLFSSHLAAKQAAAIVNVSSGLAFAPIAALPVYCATKAAVHSLTMSLRRQLRDTSIKVFEIIPPSVDTELGRERRSDTSRTHGGMPVADFVNEVWKAFEQDTLEAAIGQASGLRAGRDQLFDRMNP